MAQLSNKLIWATDNTFQGRGAKVCIVKKNQLNEIKIIDGCCGDNEIRNFIKLNENYALAVSESKLNMKHVTLSLINISSESIEGVFNIPNERGKKGNFMNGISSTIGNSGVFYSQNDNVILYPASKIIRWIYEFSK